MKSNCKNNPDSNDNRLLFIVTAHISTSECYISLERYNYDESTHIIVETLCKYPDIQIHIRKLSVCEKWGVKWVIEVHVLLSSSYTFITIVMFLVLTSGERI